MNFALICEGVSEHKVISHIVGRYIGTDCVLNRVQPKTLYSREGEKQDGPGGWQEVLNHCNDEEIKNALIFNDYVIVQIDTDSCQEKNYGVELRDENGNLKTQEMLYEEIRKLLSKNISEEFVPKLIFAICFDEIECWLLPALCSHDKICDHATGCVRKLNVELSKIKNMPTIPDAGKNTAKAQKAYAHILSKMKKKKTIEEWSVFNHGFKKFIEQLSQLTDDQGN